MRQLLTAELIAEQKNFTLKRLRRGKDFFENQ